MNAYQVAATLCAGTLLVMLLFAIRQYIHASKDEARDHRFVSALAQVICYLTLGVVAFAAFAAIAGEM